METEKIVDYLNNLIFFKGIEIETLRRFVELSELQQFDPEEIVLKEGDENPNFYVIISGSVNVSVNEDNKKDTYVCMIGEGEVFGEAGLFKKIKSINIVIKNIRLVCNLLHTYPFDPGLAPMESSG